MKLSKYLLTSGLALLACIAAIPASAERVKDLVNAVSYTHLTLPTILRV